MLAWLSVWSEVQIVCVWSSWCHCIPKPHHLLPHLYPDWFFTFVEPSYPGCPGIISLNGCSSSGNNNNNNTNNSHDNVYGAVVVTKVIARVHPVHLMNVDWAPGGRQPSDQASRLGLWVRRKCLCSSYCTACFYSCAAVNQGPDLQSILRQSYDYLTIMPKLRSTYDWRVIYKTSYNEWKAFHR